jgi:Helix-turn-helix of DDE superfamily endonuclease
VEPSVDEAIDQDPLRLPEGLPYCSTLPLPRQTLSYVTGVIRRHRRQIGSTWRKLNPGRQALLVLAYLRKGERFADLAAGFGIGTATAWRYVTETVGLLAAARRRCARRWPMPCGPGMRMWCSAARWFRSTACGGPAVLLRQAPPARDEPAATADHDHGSRGPHDDDRPLGHGHPPAMAVTA